MEIETERLTLEKLGNQTGNIMEALGIMGFIFGLAALGKVLLLEKKLKEKGVLERDDKEE